MRAVGSTWISSCFTRKKIACYSRQHVFARESLVNTFQVSRFTFDGGVRCLKFQLRSILLNY